MSMEHQWYNKIQLLVSIYTSYIVLEVYCRCLPALDLDAYITKAELDSQWSVELSIPMRHEDRFIKIIATRSSWRSVVIHFWKFYSCMASYIMMYPSKSRQNRDVSVVQIRLIATHLAKCVFLSHSSPLKAHRAFSSLLPSRARPFALRLNSHPQVWISRTWYCAKRNSA